MKIDTLVGGGLVKSALIAPVPIPLKLLGLYLGGGMVISAGIVKANLQTEATKAISEMQTAQSLEKITDKIIDGLTPEEEKVIQLKEEIAKKDAIINRLKAEVNNPVGIELINYEEENKKRDAEIARLKAELQKA